MDTKGAIRVYERFEGRGKAYKGEQFIADVYYLIKEVEEVLKIKHFEGGTSEEVAGQRNICGIVRSPQADVLSGYVGARLTLHFQDGLMLDFTVSKKVKGKTCLIQGLGGFRKRC